MKERPILFSDAMVRAILEGRKTQTRRVVKPSWIPLVEEVLRVNGKWVFDTFEYDLTTPYGLVGDRLWVRETWRSVNSCDYGGVVAHTIAYRADDPTNVLPGRWKPSIHMPRWASRITLEITGVRVERVQEISVKAAIAEGIKQIGQPYIAKNTWVLRDFRDLWDSINAARGFGWDMNPWVWVIEFKRIGGDK